MKTIDNVYCQFLFLFILFGSLSLFPTTDTYADDDQQQKNYEARIDIGMMYLYSANNLNPDASSRWISSLDKSAKSQSSILAAPIPTLSYTFEQYGNTKIYLNSRPPIDEAGSFALGVGISRPFENLGTADLVLFATPFAEVWENPYLVDEAREETSTTRYGTVIRFKDVLDTQFGLDLIYLNDDVDDDIIGMLDMAERRAKYQASKQKRMPRENKRSLSDWARSRYASTNG